MNKTIKVLMVDDEEKFRATTKKILDRRGFQTILAANGHEALEKLAEKPDVVVLDIKMPDMDGHEVLVEIKKQSPELPVIMLTGHGALPSAREALDVGAFDYLLKPCDIDLLTSKIKDACRQETVEGIPREKLAGEIMIPIDEYTVLHEENTVSEAMMRLKESIAPQISTNLIVEKMHRSVLVLDDREKVKGLLTITDLLQAIMPKYLSAPKPSMADSMVYSAIFWKGMFTQQVGDLVKKKVKDIMSPAPLSINADANLMEVAHSMVKNNIRRLTVTHEGEVVGVVRELDLFFEIDAINRG